MKFLAKLEKKSTSWILIGLCIIFFLLRFPSLVEPYWYGDEGIYEVIGQSLNQGHLLYRDIWDNKPPLLYIVYALAQGDQPTVKLLSLLTGLLTVIAYYFLAQKLFNKQKISIVTSSIFVLLFASPLLEANIANAENFMLLPIIIAGILIYSLNAKLSKQHNNVKKYAFKSLFIAGILLGIAFLFKIVAIFDLAAFFLFFVIAHLPQNVSSISIKRIFVQFICKYGGILFLGFLLPFIISILYFFINSALKEYFQTVFFGNVDYVGWKNNLFGISQGLLIIKTVLLVIGVAIIIKTRKFYSPFMLFILIWTLFSLFNAYFSGRPYTHYSLVFLPSFSLFIGLLFTAQKVKIKLSIVFAVIVISTALTFQFGFNPLRSFAYYQNVILFLNEQKSVNMYQSFFDQKVPRDYTVATFIKTHTTNQDNVFVWGNNPQIYAMSHKLPPGKYTVAYHIAQNDAFDETQHAINISKPKYIIVLDETQPLPFVIPLYIMRYTISGATFYERSL